MFVDAAFSLEIQGGSALTMLILRDNPVNTLRNRADILLKANICKPSKAMAYLAVTTSPHIGTCCVLNWM